MKELMEALARRRSRDLSEHMSKYPMEMEMGQETAPPMHMLHTMTPEHGEGISKTGQPAQPSKMPGARAGMVSPSMGKMDVGGHQHDENARSGDESPDGEGHPHLGHDAGSMGTMGKDAAAIPAPGHEAHMIEAMLGEATARPGTLRGKVKESYQAIMNKKK